MKKNRGNGGLAVAALGRRRGSWRTAGMSGQVRTGRRGEAGGPPTAGRSGGAAAGHDPQAHPGRGGVLGRVPGEPAAAAAGRRGEAARRRGLLGGVLEHRLDLGDVDDVDVQGPRAGRLSGLGAVAFRQPDQPVGRPHHHPRLIAVQQPPRVDPGALAVARGLGDQAVHGPGGVPLHPRRHVRSVGGPAAGMLPRVGLDQLVPQVHLHQVLIGAGHHRAPACARHVPPRHRVQRPGHLDVVINVDFHFGPVRHLVPLRRGRQQARRLLRGEHHRGHLPGGAVHPRVRQH